MRFGHLVDFSGLPEPSLEALESRRLLSVAVHSVAAPKVSTSHPATIEIAAKPAIVPRPVTVAKPLAIAKPAPVANAPVAVTTPVVSKPVVKPPIVKKPAPAPPLPPPPAVWVAQPIVTTNMSANTPAVAGGASPRGLTPAQIRSAYGVGNVSFNGISGDGSGQTIAIVDAYDDPTALTDLNAFSAYFGLPMFNAGAGSPTFTKVNQIGGAVTPTRPGTDPAGPVSNQGTYSGDWEVEEALDIEWSHVIAPAANIVLVEADNANGGLDLAVNTAKSYAGVDVVSMSWGGFEQPASIEKTNDTTYFSQPTSHIPVTFLASTGDEGIPEYPATSPNVVAVGGTTLTVNGNAYISESAWVSGGGGPSKYETEPSYQTNAGIKLGNGFRTVPDVSMEADPNYGVPIYDSYDFSTAAPWFPFLVGGTSLSAPMWAGLVAIADQGRSLNGVTSLSSSQTLAALYTLPSSDFIDITAGNNNWPATVGYDMASGIGSPIPATLVPDLAGFAESVVNSAYFKLDADTVHLDEWINSATPGIGAPTVQYPIADIGGISFNGAAGNDTLTLDYSAGNFAALFQSSFEPSYNTGITFTGSANGNNQLSVIGTASNDTLTAATTVTSVPTTTPPSHDTLTPPLTATTNTLAPGGGMGAMPITLNNVQTIQFLGGSGGTDTLNINGTPAGGYIVSADTAAGTPNVTVNIGGAALAVAFASTQHLAALAIQGAGDVVTLMPSATTDGKALVVGSLSIAGTLAMPTARLDLTNNAMVINDATPGHAMTVSNVNAWIDDAADIDPSTGYPRWDGNGIASSTLLTGGLNGSIDSLHNVGVADNATLGAAAQALFAGQTVNQNSILIGYTLTGDSNMDGTVNNLDMQNLMSGYGQAGTWQQGDFNHDGLVNILDVQQIDGSYGQTLS